MNLTKQGANPLKSHPIASRFGCDKIWSQLYSWIFSLQFIVFCRNCWFFGRFQAKILKKTNFGVMGHLLVRVAPNSQIPNLFYVDKEVHRLKTGMCRISNIEDWAVARQFCCFAFEVADDHEDIFHQFPPSF